jgi:hypothetical protein
MSNSNENSNDSDTRSEREPLPETEGTSSGNDAPESSERDLNGSGLPGDRNPLTMPELGMTDLGYVEIADFDCPENAPLEAEAAARADVDGATDDGLSPVYLDGVHRFVTPCHVSVKGLRASQVCATCYGDLRKPVDTAVSLPCGHWTTVQHSSGDRKTFCTNCGEWSLVRAEKVIVTRFFSRPLPVAEQIDLGL